MVSGFSTHRTHVKTTLDNQRFFMTDIQAWAFLVGCNQYLDYRTIVAPTFMCESKTSSLLAKAAGGDLTEVGTAYYREIHNSKVGDLTLVFRVIEATSENTGIEGQGVLKDSFGREIDLIEGIVFKGLQPNIVVTQENLEEIHQKIIVHYQDFWNTTTSQPAIALETLTWIEDNHSNNCFKYIKLKNYDLDFREQKAIEKSSQFKQSQSWESLDIKKYNGEITSVVYVPDQKSIIYRHERTVIISNLEKKQYKELFVKRKLPCDPLTPVSISQNGEFVATAIIDKEDRNLIKIWDINNIWNSKNDEISPIVEYESYSFGVIGSSIIGRIHAVEFSPDNTILVSAGAEKTIFLWDVSGSGERGRLYGHSSTVRTIAISPDGKLMASGDDHGDIKIWNWQTRQEIDEINIRLPVRTLAFSPDSKILVSAGDDCHIKLWNIDTRTEITAFEKHSEPINTVVFSPDGQIIASGSDDCTVKLWNVQKKIEIAELKGHNKGVTSVSFSSDGRTLVSGSKDKTIRFWIGA
jgi:WD40 repeat protein